MRKPVNPKRLVAALRDIEAWLPAWGACPAEGTSAAAPDKPASPGLGSHAQGATLGSSPKPSAIRFSGTAFRCLPPCRLPGVHLNPRKTIIQPVARGIDFVGHVIKPWRRTTRPRTLASALTRIEHLPEADTYAAGNSYLGLVRQASHNHKERAAICRALLKRGHAVEGLRLSQAFRRTTP